MECEWVMNMTSGTSQPCFFRSITARMNTPKLFVLLVKSAYQSFSVFVTSKQI